MAEERINTHAKYFAEKNGLTLAITHLEKKYLIGAIGMAHIAKEYWHDELGYWIGKPFRGNGYCTEAVRALLDYSFKSLKLNRVFAFHYVHNPASGQVLQKTGMIYEGRLRKHVNKCGKYINLNVYGILQEEFIL